MERPTPSSLPTTPGVYLYKDAAGRIIYVGKAVNLRKRVLSYFRPPAQLTPKTVAMIGHAASLETLSTTTEKEALLLEASLIKKHRPRYNIVLRDDKQYVLFRLSTKDDFPRLEITRTVRKRDGARYFGPFTSGLAARETWKTIHRIFPLRRCTDRALRNRVKPCLYAHLNLCLAPCTGEVSKEDYAALTHRVHLLLAGKSRELIDRLRTDMEAAAERLDFELAADIRDQIQAIEKTIERQGVVLQRGGDMDVIGLTTLADGLSLGIIFVREGRVLDRNTFFWPGLGLEEAGEVIWSFLNQFYTPRSSIPPRVIIPWLPGEPLPEDDPELATMIRSVTEDGASAADTGPEDDEWEGDMAAALSTHAALEAALSEIRGGPVHISAPRNPEEHRLVDMAKANAREAARSRKDIPLDERLAVIFGFERPIHRIECVDVSHTSGQATKVGVVVYEDGKPHKNDYRTWNMDDTHGDDYAALSQWAERRYRHGAPWPDLLLVDGGKGQLAVVHKALQAAFETIPFVLAGIAKARDEYGRADRRAGNVGDRIFVPGRSNPLSLRDGSPELLYLQAVRDAAHDFSIGRHRQARARLAFSGELQRLPGIGPHTARLLWENFNSIEDMRQATRAQIAGLPGIGPKRAEKIWHSLQSL